MKIRTIQAAVLVGSVLVLAPACSKKKSKSSSEAGAAVLNPTEDAEVTLPTSQLLLASAVTILPAKSGETALQLNGKKAYALNVDGRTLYLRVSNEAFRSIEQAGSIMCFFGQTKFWEQANQGVYKAMIDESLCERKSEGGGQGGGDSGSSRAQELMLMYSKATREENKPLIGEFRIPEGDATIHAKVIVVAPPTDENPAGIFNMAYTFYGPDGQAGQYGFIRTKRTESGAFVLETAQNESNGTDRSGHSFGVAELTRDAESNEFIGYVRSDSSFAEGGNSSTEAYKARFDSNYMNVSGGGVSNWNGHSQEQKADGCYDRNQYKTGIYRYDLADASGKTVTLNSGFPAEFDVDGKTYQANASYYGLWTNGMNLASGSTVYKVEWTQDGGKNRTPYTLFKAAGKLVKLTKATTTLGALKGVDLMQWDNGTNYIIRWDGSKLVKVSKVNYTDKGMEEEAASGEVTIPEWGLNIHVSSLNASVNLSSKVALSDATVISYHSEETVSGTTDVPSGDLVCFANCPSMSPTASAFQRSQGSMNGPMSSQLYKTTTVTWGDQSFTSNQSQNISTALATYSYDSTSMLLKEGSNAFTLPSGLPSSEDELRNLDSVRSGALIPVAAWQALTDKGIDPYRAEQEVSVYYRWYAGASSWDQFQSLKDAQGTFVKFDKPIELNYTLVTADEFDGMTDTNVVGKAYRLNYGGPGQLWGIPWKYNQAVGHEMPLFNLKAGTKIGDYTVYPLEGDQRMASTDAANCANLSLDDLPELPALENSSVNVGTFGDDNSPTRYIAGVATN